jgi:RNase P/RNase MRP subunit p29
MKRAIFMLMLLAGFVLAVPGRVPAQPDTQSECERENRTKKLAYQLTRLQTSDDVIVTRDGCGFRGEVTGETDETVTIQTKYGEQTIPAGAMLYGRWNDREHDSGMFRRDVVRVMNGSRFTGRIVQMDSSGLVMQTDGGMLRIPLDDAIYVNRDTRRVPPALRGHGLDFPPNIGAKGGALDWLHWHQTRWSAPDPLGVWDAEGFDRWCEGTKCANAQAVSRRHNVTVTSLSLLAFLGNGQTHRVGQFKYTVKLSLKWLITQQDKEGWLGRNSGSKKWILNHATGTMALCEAYALSRDFKLKAYCEEALKCIINARNKDGGWGWEPSDGDSNTLITGWMVLALKCAKTGGFDIPEGAFTGAVKWFDSCTDPKTGRVGYRKFAGPKKPTADSAEVPEENPTMTAIAVICSIFCGRKRQHDNVMKGVDVLMKNLPQWDESGKKVDPMYWYLGTYSIFQYGGKKWSEWNTAMKKVLLDSQRRDGCASGSWDPEGAWWGISGGRVMSTALGLMTLRIYYAYMRVNPGDNMPRDTWFGMK